MPVIARDAVASDHLVYAWPFPIGPEEHEVVCAEDEQVVMCPAWLVGNLLNVGRHRWRTPNPMHPVHAFFVLTAPVEVSFDMVTMFIVPSSGEGVRLRATGSLQVRCTDPGLLIAQFVGLPFDLVNEGILRSVSRSVERMLARLLTRRVVMAGTSAAVTDPQMQAHIQEELVAYNPAAGAVFGVELVRMGHLAVLADDGSRPLEELVPSLEWSGHHRLGTNGDRLRAATSPLVETQRESRTPRSQVTPPLASPAVMPPLPDDELSEPPGRTSEGGRRQLATTMPPPATSIIVEPPPLPPMGSSPRASSQPSQQASGEIIVRPRNSIPPVAPPSEVAEGTPLPPPSTSRARPGEAALPDGSAVLSTPRTTALGVAALAPSAPPAPKAEVVPPGTPTPRSMPSVPGVLPRRPSSPPVETPRNDEITQPSTNPPSASPSMSMSGRIGVAEPEQPRGSIMGIGVSHIGSSQVASGEISNKVAPGARVLVPGPNGLMQSATVRQLLQGYYELEVGASGETIWVPINGVVPHE